LTKLGFGAKDILLNPCHYHIILVYPRNRNDIIEFEEEPINPVLVCAIAQL